MFESYINKLKPYFSFQNIVIAIISVPVLMSLILLLTDDSDEYAQVASASYSVVQARCAPGSRAGPAGITNGEPTRYGIDYNVRTPSNYDATIAHSLLMVYAPARANEARIEKLTKLTFEATAAGFIVAYADHPELSTTTTVQLGTIPGLIAKKWCIDENRIFLTGHSDGGAVAMALGFIAGTKPLPAAIAPSAAGIRGEDLRGRKCPEPVSVMVMHSKKDHLFPGYGAESSGWWAFCNQCSPIPKKLENGCMAYPNCAKNVKTWFCEGDKVHKQWPAINQTLIGFLSAAGRDSQ